MADNKSPLDIAREAERDLNSHAAKTGNTVGASDSTDDSGNNEAATAKFPGSTVTIGSAASGAGDNREIPVEEGGSISKTGRPTKAKDFEGVGGPEDKQRAYVQQQGGNDDIRDNVRN